MLYTLFTKLWIEKKLKHIHNQHVKLSTQLTIFIHKTLLHYSISMLDCIAMLYYYLGQA